MNKPYFIIAGGQKCGSTWLAAHLRKHPSIYLYNKEIHFFDKKKNFEKGASWYFDSFRDAKDGQIAGEKTPDYLFTGEAGEDHLPDTQKRIKTIVPDVKIIIIVRNPVKRAISAVKHMMKSGRVSPLYSIDDYLFGEKKHLIEEHKVIEYGFYIDHIEKFYESFPKKNIKIIFFEEVMKNKSETLKDCFEFLGVESDVEVSEDIEKKINASAFNKWFLYLKYNMPYLAKVMMMLKIPLLLPTTEYQASNDSINRLNEVYRPYSKKLFETLRKENIWKN
jgi:hypothetical protein